jgi:hypothetical protein
LAVAGDLSNIGFPGSQTRLARGERQAVEVVRILQAQPVAPICPAPLGPSEIQTTRAGATLRSQKLPPVFMTFKRCIQKVVFPASLLRPVKSVFEPLATTKSTSHSSGAAAALSSLRGTG